MAVDRSEILRVQIAVIKARCADIDADLFARDRRWLDARVFERFPDHLHQQALLRIDLLCFARRHAEDARIEIKG